MVWCRCSRKVEWHNAEAMGRGQRYGAAVPRRWNGIIILLWQWARGQWYGAAVPGSDTVAMGRGQWYSAAVPGRWNGIMLWQY